MKRLALIVGVLFVAIAVNAQKLEEKDGIYYQDSELYSGKYTTYHDNGKIKMESYFLEGKKHGKCKLFLKQVRLMKFVRTKTMKCMVFG